MKKKPKAKPEPNTEPEQTYEVLAVMRNDMHGMQTTTIMYSGDIPGVRVGSRLVYKKTS